MDIKNWASVICAVAIISGILVVIIPESKIKKVYNIIVTIFLVYAFLLPIVNENYATFDFGDFLYRNEKLKKEYNEESFDIFEESAKSVLESEIAKKLKDSGVDAKVRIECEVKEDNFEIHKIAIICSEYKKTESIINEILSEFKTENTKVVFEGE